MRLELFGGCKVESDELSNSVLFGLFFVVLFFFYDYPAMQGVLTCR